MRYAGNAIWFVLGGWITSGIWILGAFIFGITVIGLPFCRAAFELAKLSAFPFGKEIVRIDELNQSAPTPMRISIRILSLFFNVLWACTFGIILFFLHLTFGLIYCFSIVGIPFGLQHFKLAALSIFPIGRRVVTLEAAEIIRQNNASREIYQARH